MEDPTPNGHGLEIVCPTCESLLAVDTPDDLAPGDPIRAFCNACERTAEITAPAGIHAATNGADTLENPLTEFPPTPSSDSS